MAKVGRKPPSIAAALTRALKAAEVKPEDAALVALAKSYAAQLDRIAGSEAESAGLAKVSPGFMAVLTELGMTPRSRISAGRAAGAAGGGAPNGSVARTTFDELRARRGTGSD